MRTKHIDRAWETWVEEHVARGWRPYLISVTYHQIRGSERNVMKTMRDEIMRVYKTILCQIVRRPRSPSSIGQHPIMLAAPDYPVHKKNKDSLHIGANEGLHWHAILLIPPITRRPFDLITDFEDRAHCYYGSAYKRVISKIDIKEIFVDLAYTVDYALKGVRNGRIDRDEMMILPRSITEL